MGLGAVRIELKVANLLASSMSALFWQGNYFSDRQWYPSAFYEKDLERISLDVVDILVAQTCLIISVNRDF
ncbi:MAG: hypothetical protein ACLS3V_00100 [Streptococcus sp.]